VHGQQNIKITTVRQARRMDILHEPSDKTNSICTLEYWQSSEMTLT